MTAGAVPTDELVEALGAGNVSTEPAELEARSHDSWPVAVKWARMGRHPHPAEVVVRPGTAGEVADVLRIARAAERP